MILPFVRDAFVLKDTQLKEAFYDKIDFSKIPNLKNWYDNLYAKYSEDLADARGYANLLDKNIEANGPKVQLFYPLF